MERDPLRLAWKTSPLRHLFGFLLLALAGLLLLLGLDLVRTVADRAVAGAWREPATLLRVAFTPPSSLWREPLVEFSGFALGPDAFALVSIGGVVLLPILIGLVLVAVDWTMIGISTRVMARVRSAILDAILRSSPSGSSAQEDVSTLTALASGALARENGVLGASLLVPVQLGGMIGLAFSYVLVTDWPLGATLAVVFPSSGLKSMSPW